MSLFSRGGNGPTEGRCGPSEGGWSAQGHMQWFFPCPCSPVFAGLLCTLTKWVPHTHVWCRGKLEHAQKPDYISLKNNQKWSKNLKITMYILKVDDTSRISRCFPGAEPERGRMHDMGSLSPAYNALWSSPLVFTNLGLLFVVFGCWMVHPKLHMQLSILWSLNLHPIL